MNICDMTVAELISALDNGETTSEKVTAACLNRIQETEHLNNYITVCTESALNAARQADIMRSSGSKSQLLGVPIAIKDNIQLGGVRTTCASKFLADNIPTEDAAVVKRLKALGAVIIGKTNMDEMAFGSTNEYSAYGRVLNALDNTRVPGGSSGGSANTVAAGQAPLALGTDTGGSVRQPAAYCGVVGLKPTNALIDKTGLIGLSPSLDQIGTISRTCDDALTLLAALIGGHGDHVETVRLPEKLDGGIAGKTIGIAKEFLQADMSDGVRRAFLNAIEKLKSLGASITDVSLPSFGAGLSAYHVLSSAEAAYTFNKFNTSEQKTTLLGAEVKRRLVTGTAVVSGDNYERLYVQAAKVRAVIKTEFAGALKTCDVLLSPTVATVATPFGAQTDPKTVHGNDVFLAPVSLAGLPAVSVPFGTDCGMPIGIHIIGRQYADGEILNIGKALMGL